MELRPVHSEKYFVEFRHFSYAAAPDIINLHTLVQNKAVYLGRHFCFNCIQ